MHILQYCAYIIPQSFLLDNNNYKSLPQHCKTCLTSIVRTYNMQLSLILVCELAYMCVAMSVHVEMGLSYWLSPLKCLDWYLRKQSVSRKTVWQKESWHSLQCKGYHASCACVCSSSVAQMMSLATFFHWNALLAELFCWCWLTDLQARHENPSFLCLWRQCEGDVKCNHSLLRGWPRTRRCICNASCPSDVPCSSLETDHYD